MEKDPFKRMPEEVAEDLQHESAVPEPLRKKAKIDREKVKLSIGDAIIVASKQKLIQDCPYFASLLRFHADGNMDRVSLVPPENVDVDVFLAVLYSLSNGNVNLDITAANLWDLIVLSKYFLLDQLEQKCMLTFRKLLPTLDFDKLCWLWRKAYAIGCNEVTAPTFGMIVLKMEFASQSLGFLSFSGAELVALLSDEGFLPLVEGDVCKAVAAWCEHDPANRKTLEVLKPILTEVMRDSSIKHIFESFGSECEKQGDAPKRVTDSENHWIPDDKLLKRLDCKNGVIVGNTLFTIAGSASDRVFFRMDVNSRARTIVKSFERFSPSYDTDDYDEDADEHHLCLVKLPNSDRIGCLISYLEDVDDTSKTYRKYRMDKIELKTVLLLYDVTADTWVELPDLPLPRMHTAMIQLGSFLCVVGGEEHKWCRSGGDDPDWPHNAHHCYRLDLGKLPVHQKGEEDVEWERIADLNAPRKEHSVKVKYGRVIVYGGQTVSKRDKESDEDFEESDDESDAQFEHAQWSEAYDVALNIWAIFKPEA